MVGFAPLLTAVPYIAISDASSVRDCSADIRILDAAIWLTGSRTEDVPGWTTCIEGPDTVITLRTYVTGGSVGWTFFTLN